MRDIPDAGLRFQTLIWHHIQVWDPKPSTPPMVDSCLWAGAPGAQARAQNLVSNLGCGIAGRRLSDGNVSRADRHEVSQECFSWEDHVPDASKCAEGKHEFAGFASARGNARGCAEEMGREGEGEEEGRVQ